MSKGKTSGKITYREFGEDPSPPLDRPDLPPQQQQVRVQVSRAGRKGKTVTIITGVQGSDTTLQGLLKQFKNLCGSGGTLKEGILEIQGDHGVKLCDRLRDLGYKAKISGG